MNIRKSRQSYKFPIHFSAKPSHYNKEAEHYDTFNEKNAAQINRLIEKIFKKHRIKTILDLACGTGSQVLWFAKSSYEVVGVDINNKMLKLAKAKARKENLDIKLIKGDMRTIQAGKFDAVITIFNAVGHLTKSDFEKTIRNIHGNLNDKGIYVFDIFNLSYFLKDDNVSKLTIDWQKKSGNKMLREIQYSTINGEGILASYDIYHEQEGVTKPKISKAFQTLQIYSAEQLDEMLQKNGYEVLLQCGVDGAKLNEATTDRIVTVAKKK